LRFIVVASAVLLALTGCSVGPSSYSYGLQDASLLQGFANPPNGGFVSTKLDSSHKRRTGKAPAAQESSTAQSSSKKTIASDGKTQLNVRYALNRINQHRRENGLPPVRLDVLLTKAAKAHASDLAKWDRISHFGSDGSNPWERVKRTGYHASLAAENVGTGQKTFDEVMAGWKKSEGHNKNLLLSDAKHIGIALVYAPKTEFRTFWTLVVGAPS